MAERKRVGNIDVIICEDEIEAAKESANIFAEAIRQKPNLVLGLATGGTPVSMYKELIKMNKEGELDFFHASTFNLDEYVGLSPEHDQSYRYFMNTNLFDHVNIDKSKTYVLDGLTKDIDRTCREYEDFIKKQGGIDVQLLGIGANGHIAFNEPGSSKDSRTREVVLTEKTIKDNSRFFEDESQVPRKALTMGIATIMEARKIVLLATGSNKKDAVKKALQEASSLEVPASFLKEHDDCIFVLDKDAAGGL